MSFSSRKIVNANTLGKILQEARTDQGISLREASADLNIAFKYLEAMENNDLSAIPGEAYLKSFLRLYCRYLRLNFSECLSMAKKMEVYQDQKFQDIEKRYFLLLPKYIKWIITTVIILAVVFFLAVKIDNIFAPPELEIYAPVDGLTTMERELEIIGKSEKESEIVINNRNIIIDNEGGFKTTVNLQKGINSIKIIAKKRYSREKVIELGILLTEE